MTAPEPPRMTVTEMDFLIDLLERAKLGATSAALTGSGERAWTFGIEIDRLFHRMRDIRRPCAEALARAPDALGRCLSILQDARNLAKAGDVEALRALLDFPRGSKAEANIPSG